MTGKDTCTNTQGKVHKKARIDTKAGKKRYKGRQGKLRRQAQKAKRRARKRITAGKERNKGRQGNA